MHDECLLGLVLPRHQKGMSRRSKDERGQEEWNVFVCALISSRSCWPSRYACQGWAYEVPNDISAAGLTVRVAQMAHQMGRAST